MAATSLSKSLTISSQAAKTFHIIYGWAEGRWHTRQLVKTLQRRGFTEAPKAEATVIIAHSAGSFFVPPDSDKQISVIIGFPIWPGKSLVRASLQKLWLDITTNPPRYWIQKTGWNIFYLATHPYLTFLEWKALHQANPFLAIPKTAILIRNTQDAYCPPTLAALVKNTVVELPGQHDDLWQNSDPYVEIIEEAYARLLA